MAVRTVSILGSTGSIGRSTVDLLRHHRDKYQVNVLTAQTNVDLLADQARELGARKAVIGDEALYADLKDRLAGTGIEIAAGRDAIIAAAADPADWTMAAIVGMAGLEPILEAIKQGHCVAIANKEPLVAAGQLVIDTARASGATLLPVDSEHNAVFQVFDEANRGGIERIVLTASGGPFRTWSQEQMAAATPEQAVAHPNWSMGAKISVDSASMMNKALEVIEARWLFDLPPERIKVVIHPQSIIHSMVVTRDLAVLAQLGTPDMKGPIAFGLSWPARMTSGCDALDFTKLAALTFEEADEGRFPGLHLSWAALRAPAGSTAVLNAANEIAVEAFLDGRLRFDGIHRVNAQALERVLPSASDVTSLEALVALDARARDAARAHVRQLAGSAR